MQEEQTPDGAVIFWWTAGWQEPAVDSICSDEMPSHHHQQIGAERCRRAQARSRRQSPGPRRRLPGSIRRSNGSRWSSTTGRPGRRIRRRASGSAPWGLVINDKTLSVWVIKYGRTEKVTQARTGEQKELDEARKRIKELESENEFLKKQQPSSPGASDDGLSHASSHWHISYLSVCREWPTAIVGPEAEMQNLRTVMWRASGMPSWGMF